MTEPLRNELPSGGDRPFTCSVATNVVSSALLTAIVSVIWIGGLGQRQALRRYRRRLTSDPAALLDLPVHLTDDEARHRSALKAAVLKELRSTARGEPLVVEGDSGTGKSVTLVDGAGVERRRLPVRPCP